MKNYNQKSGMLMIWRAVIMTVIALPVFWVAYKVCAPKEIKPEIHYSRDLSDIAFETNSRGDFIRVR